MSSIIGLGLRLVEKMREIVVGGVPRPIGGVTTFVRRYVCSRGKAVQKIIDFYPGDKDILPLDCQSKLKVVSGVWGLVVWFLIFRHSCGTKRFFFNFSTPRACLIFLVLFKRRDEKWSLMLHHGELSITTWLHRAMIQMALRKIDEVRYISEVQRVFYQAISISSDKLFEDTSYIPPVDHLDDEAAVKKLSKLRTKFRTLTVISGFPTALYNIEDAINAFQNLAGDQAGLCVFIYGPGELRANLYDLAARFDNIEIFDGYQECYFNTFLKNADLFLRLTDVDSVGISVWDAFFWKVKIVATDVCKRPDTAYLVRSGVDEHELRDVVQEALSRSNVS